MSFRWVKGHPNTPGIRKRTHLQSMILRNRRLTTHWSSYGLLSSEGWKRMHAGNERKGGMTPAKAGCINPFFQVWVLRRCKTEQIWVRAIWIQFSPTMVSSQRLKMFRYSELIWWWQGWSLNIWSFIVDASVHCGRLTARSVSIWFATKLFRLNHDSLDSCRKMIV